MRFPFPAIAAAFRERREVRQPFPDVSDEDVERIVRRNFPNEQFDSVMAALGAYSEGRPSRKSPRVLLATLKLADGDIESLRNHIVAARRDYRDVLGAAEYPEYTRRGPSLVRRLSRKEQERIVGKDWDEYARWLGK